VASEKGEKGEESHSVERLKAANAMKEALKESKKKLERLEREKAQGQPKDTADKKKVAIVLPEDHATSSKPRSKLTQSQENFTSAVATPSKLSGSDDSLELPNSAPVSRDASPAPSQPTKAHSAKRLKSHSRSRSQPGTSAIQPKDQARLMDDTVRAVSPRLLGVEIEGKNVDEQGTDATAATPDALDVTPQPIEAAEGSDPSSPDFDNVDTFAPPSYPPPSRPQAPLQGTESSCQPTQGTESSAVPPPKRNVFRSKSAALFGKKKLQLQQAPDGGDGQGEQSIEQEEFLQQRKVQQLLLLQQGEILQQQQQLQDSDASFEIESVNVVELSYPNPTPEPSQEPTPVKQAIDELTQKRLQEAAFLQHRKSMPRAPMRKPKPPQSLADSGSSSPPTPLSNSADEAIDGQASPPRQASESPLSSPKSSDSVDGVDGASKLSPSRDFDADFKALQEARFLNQRRNSQAKQAPPKRNGSESEPKPVIDATQPKTRGVEVTAPVRPPSAGFSFGEDEETFFRATSNV
jgi:hypothetical protein